MKLLAKPNENDPEMIELWSEQATTLWAVVHIDMFTMEDYFIQLAEGEDIVLDVRVD